MAYLEVFAALLFAAGAVIQAFLMTRDTRIVSQTAPMAAGLALVVSVLYFFEGATDPSTHLLIFSFFFALLFVSLFSAEFKKQALPSITEASFLSVGLTSAYAFLLESEFAKGATIAAAGTIVFAIILVLVFERIGFGSLRDLAYRLLLVGGIAVFFLLALFIWWPLALLLAAAGVFCVLRLLSRRELSSEEKPFFYAFFLAMLVFCFGFVYAPKILSAFSSQAVFGSWFEALTSGMLLAYLGFFAWQLFEVVPLPGKNQSVESRVRDWHEHMNVLAIKFSGTQMTGAYGVALLLQAGLLAANHLVQVVEPRFAVELMILAALSAASTRAGGAGQQTRREKPLRAAGAKKRI